MTYQRNRSPTLADVIRAGMEDNRSNFHTMLPGKVTEFDASKKSCSVQPLIQRTFFDDDGDEIKETLPVIVNVPVIYPEGAAGGGQKYSITFPLDVGSYVMLMFCERSVDKYLDGDGSVVDPIDFRMHNLGDPVAIPGFAPYSERPTQEVEANAMVLGLDNGTQIYIEDGKIALNNKNAGDKAVLDSKVQSELNALKSSLEALVTAFNAHIHITTATVLTGPPGVIAPTTSQATPPASIQATNSEVVTLD